MPKFGVNLLLWADKFDRESVALIPPVAEMGFDGVEIPVFDPKTVDIAHTKSVLDDLGLEVLTCAIMGPDRDPISDDPSVRQNGKDYLKSCVEVTAELGGDTFIGPMYSAVGRLVGRGRTDQEWNWCVDALSDVAEHARRYEVRLGIEPLNRFETYFINIAEDAVNLAKVIDNPYLGVHLDTFHMNIEEKNQAQAILDTGDWLYHVHCCENDRGTPGSGLVDWDDVFKALKQINYDRWLVIESFTPDVKEIAKATAIWRQIAPSAEVLAIDGLAFLKEMADQYLSN